MRWFPCKVLIRLPDLVSHNVNSQRFSPPPVEQRIFPLGENAVMGFSSFVFVLLERVTFLEVGIGGLSLRSNRLDVGLVVMFCVLLCLLLLCLLLLCLFVLLLQATIMLLS